MAGYSATPLSKKLGIKNHFTIRLVNEPAYYFNLFSDLPSTIIYIQDRTTPADFIHYFATRADELAYELPSLRKQIKAEGMIWISWYKRSSGMQTDISEDIIRNLALQNGLVDIKVCAVDELWSGLKLVIPVKDRKNRINHKQ